MRNNSTFSMLKRVVVTALFIFAGAFSAFAQNRVQVSGTVTDELNQPMVGVSIIEKGTQNGVLSDMNGKYTITASEGSVLEFLYLGYITVEKPVGGAR